MNWIFAAILFTILAFVGLPKIVDNQFTVPTDTTIVTTPVTIADVQQDSPAKKASLQTGDQIISINGQAINSLTDFTNRAKKLQGQTVSLSYLREGVAQQTDVALRKDQTKGSLGVTLSGSTEKYRATWSAPIVGLVTTAQLTEANFRGLGDMVAQLFRGDAKQVGESVAGPVGILAVMFPNASQAGLTGVLLLAAIISLALAVMNLLPIPGLDGGRWFTMTIFKIFGKKLTKETEDKINSTGMMILLLLVVLVTIADVGKLF